MPLSYETNDGRLLLFLKHRITSVDVSVAPTKRAHWWSFKKTLCVEPGDEITVTMSVRDETGMPVPARLPVEIRVFDATGHELDGAGYVCAEGGVCTLVVRTNLNDPPGGYRIVCRDHASGIVSEVR